jgi:hypothetical protein
MWHNNKSVTYVYAHVNTKMAYAVISGIENWKMIAPNSSDGVTNVLDILSTAKANGNNVNVYIDNDQIVAAYLV